MWQGSCGFPSLEKKKNLNPSISNTFGIDLNLSAMLCILVALYTYRSRSSLKVKQFFIVFSSRPATQSKKLLESTRFQELRVAAGEGFEPSHTESESAVLPLHNPARCKKYYTRFTGKVKHYFSSSRARSSTLSAMTPAPLSTSCSRVRKPQETETQSTPAARAVSMSTSLSPT